MKTKKLKMSFIDSLHRLRKAELDNLFKNVDFKKDQSLLEIGSGTGFQFCVGSPKNSTF